MDFEIWLGVDIRNNHNSFPRACLKKENLAECLQCGLQGGPYNQCGSVRDIFINIICDRYIYERALCRDQRKNKASSRWNLTVYQAIQKVIYLQYELVGFPSECDYII